MGVWIETAAMTGSGSGSAVTPYVGVWIETMYQPKDVKWRPVTPYVGVWIETYCCLYSY